ncbi:mitochondrial 37S ribosomal protein nam9 [Aspergillus niger]|nr:mitochondrial 37S ribosomal protein nam9 [Aspergillus niger]GLA41511.1 mitochondrial 37S ribosomal protein nam9 [Aspergillus niger]
MRNRATQHLSKPKVRQSWSKWNLYNMKRFSVKNPMFRTHFQQKWDAKSIARGYHGEQVSEKHWVRMFSPRIRSVVPMDPAKLAKDDGSALSAGRGMGVESRSDTAAHLKLSKYEKADADQLERPFPYTQATFAPLERRLDVAVFRAMFASSTRQARQFVIHGAVTVNGKKMRYPGYLLNPGDLFQVEPERVMFATGAPKDKYDRRAARVAEKEAEKEAEKKAEEAEEAKEESEAKEEDKQEVQSPRQTLQAMLSQAKNIMADSKSVLPAKRKQELRGFQKAVRRVLSRSDSNVLADNLEAQFSELTLLLKAKKAEKTKKSGNKERQDTTSANAEKSTDTKAATEVDSETQPGDKLSEAFRQAAENPEQEVDTSELTDEEFKILRRALIQMRDNPIDHSKPYATPWRPRDFMSAFATIPRYLEVNPKACAAVYLRHPVVRPGLSEVPSPFNLATGALAYHWYLRRR